MRTKIVGSLMAFMFCFCLLPTSQALALKVAVRNYLPTTDVQVMVPRSKDAWNQAIFNLALSKATMGAWGFFSGQIWWNDTVPRYAGSFPEATFTKEINSDSLSGFTGTAIDEVGYYFHNDGGGNEHTISGIFLTFSGYNLTIGIPPVPPHWTHRETPEEAALRRSLERDIVTNLVYKLIPEDWKDTGDVEVVFIDIFSKDYIRVSYSSQYAANVDAYYLSIVGEDAYNLTEIQEASDHRFKKDPEYIVHSAEHLSDHINYIDSSNKRKTAEGWANTFFVYKKGGSKTTEESIDYKTHDGELWGAKIDGDEFIHAPYEKTANGYSLDWDISRNHRDSIINYMGHNGEKWTARLFPDENSSRKFFVHYRNKDQHKSSEINYKTHDGHNWSAEVCGNKFVHYPEYNPSKKHLEDAIYYLTENGEKWIARRDGNQFIQTALEQPGVSYKWDKVYYQTWSGEGWSMELE